MNNLSIPQKEQQYLAQTYNRFDLTLSYGKGCDVWDTVGNQYLDFTSGIGTNSLGWANEQWLSAITTQASKLQHTSNLFFSEPCVTLAETLCQRSGLKRAFFCNSGAEANEGAIKTARKYSSDKYGQQRSTILTLTNSFHGRTVTTLAATGQDNFHQHFSPFTEGFDYIPANDINAVTQRISQGDVCAILVEIVQGEGGVITLQADYLLALQTLCLDNDVLLMIDEVQTGIGRTGKLFAYQHFNLQPDVVTLAKGLGGGLPTGAILFGEKCQNTLGKGEHGSTFGGNPVCCAGANAVLAQLDENRLAEITQKGEYLADRLRHLPKVKSVTGLGLMLGVEFTPEIKVTDLVNQAIQQGVLFLTAKNKLRLLPPLIISENQIEFGINVLHSILSKRTEID